MRAPVDADVPALAALAGALGYPCGASEMRERLARLAAMPGQALLVVTDASDTPLGWIHAVESVRLTAPTCVEITGLVVDERVRGEGLGQTLVEAVAAWARRRGIRRLRVHSRTCRDGAHRFYARLGFTHTKTQHVFQRELG